MFLKVNTIGKDGQLTHKYINLGLITIMHDIPESDPANKHGHKSVLYNSNGYATYSFLSTDQICAWYQPDAVSEQDIQQQEGN